MLYGVVVNRVGEAMCGASIAHGDYGCFLRVLARTLRLALRFQPLFTLSVIRQAEEHALPVGAGPVFDVLTV